MSTVYLVSKQIVRLWITVLMCILPGISAGSEADRLPAGEHGGIRVSAGNHHLKLRLSAYGYGESLHAVPPAAAPVVTANRVAYRRGDITEWYVNDAHGVEQGFTLEKPPTYLLSLKKGGQEGFASVLKIPSNPPFSKGGIPLHLALTLDTALTPELADDARSVMFKNTAGRTVFNYDKLQVFDADGRTVAAHFELPADRLHIVVADAGARYPLVIDPLITSPAVKLDFAYDDDDDNFGNALAAEGDTLVVGAPGDEYCVSFQSDCTSGMAYVYERDAGSGQWLLKAELRAAQPAFLDRFGVSVAIDGDTILVGAEGNDNGAVNAGAAYVFVKPAGGWQDMTETVKLTAATPEAEAEFGSIVDLDGDDALICARHGYNNRGPNGAAYVFVRSGGTWSQQAKLTVPDIDNIVRFCGYDFSTSKAGAISGGRVLIGVDDVDAGYLFERTGTNWSQIKKFTRGGCDLGYSAALQGDTALLGSWGCNGDQLGAAYIYERDAGGNWNAAGKLQSPEHRRFGDRFAQAMEIDGDTALVTGIDTSAAHVFVRDTGPAWSAATWGNVTSGNMALQFDGVDDYVEIPDHANLKMGTGSFTIEGWFKSNGNLNQDAAIFHKGGTDDIVYGLRVFATGGIRGGMQNGSGTFTTTFTTYNPDIRYDDSQWHHIALVVDRTANEQKVYVDGVQAGTTTDISAFTANMDNDGIGNIGRQETGWSYANAYLDEVRIWSTARSRQDIQDSMGQTLTGTEPGLMAYYQFDNTTDDHTAAGNHGILHDSPVWTAANWDNGAWDFDGYDDYVALPADSWFNGDFTIEAWVYPRRYNNWSRLLDFGNGASSDNVLVALSNGTTGKPRLGIRIGSAETVVDASNPLPLNTWSHIAVSLNGNSGVMYINGAEVARNDAMNVPANLTRNNNYIGRSNWSSNLYADALFDELRFWNIARAQADIQSDMNTTLNGNEAGLVAYYKFDETPAGGTLTDYTTGNRHGTVHGPWDEQMRFTTPETDTVGYRFGYAAALSGDYAFVSDVAGDIGTGGSVSAYERNGSDWITRDTLSLADKFQMGYSFGSSVAVSGDTVLGGHIGVTEAGAPEGGGEVFVRQGSGWSYQTQLFGKGWQFGYTSDLDGDTAVVAGMHSPSAYKIWVRDAAGNWSWQETLGGPYIGTVALSGDTLIIGSYNSDAKIWQRNSGVWSLQQSIPRPDGANARTVDVDGNTVLIGGNEKTFVYVRNGTTWSQQAVLSADDSNSNAFSSCYDAFDNPGTCLAVSGDTAVVGAGRDDARCPAATPDCNTGAAYVFIRDPASGVWTQKAKLTSADVNAESEFGWSVAVHDDTVLVGAYNAQGTGAAYLYIKPLSGWTDMTETVKLSSPDGIADGRFGWAVSVTQDTAVLGAKTANALYVFDIPFHNDAPVLDASGDMHLNAIAEDTPVSLNPGTPVSVMLASATGDRITDTEDRGDFRGFYLQCHRSTG